MFMSKLSYFLIFLGLPLMYSVWLWFEHEVMLRKSNRTKGEH